ncbi:MAG: molybdopterin molybdotransferase MoeA, partial [Paracoccaceae bacterium]
MLELDPNKAGFCGCDDLPAKTPLMSIDAAMALITASTQPVGQFETIPLAASVGRVLAQDVLARGDNPPFDNAAVDGYAVRSDAFEGQGPWVLQVTERVAAGEAPHHPLCGLQAARIFTGAPVPMGADAVVMQENTEIKDGALILSHPVRCGDHLRHRAEDMAVGACVVPSGTRLAPQHIAAIASAGWAEVRVASRLRIGLLVTGSEIHEAGQDIGGGQS